MKERFLERFEVMPCSASGSHDFHASVIDNDKTSYNKTICECFYKEDAEMIAMSLNSDNKIRKLAKQFWGDRDNADFRGRE
jgi:hypothetical protein